MPSEGPNNPSSLANDASVGVSAWSNPENAAVSDDSRATTTLGQCSDSIAKLVVGGVISGDNKATFSAFPATESYKTYGGPSDLWGATLSPAIVNSSDFGFVLSAYSDSSEANTNYLKVTNFGFAIPDGSTIDGIVVEVERRRDFFQKGEIDHVRITVHYSESGGASPVIHSTMSLGIKL